MVECKECQAKFDFDDALPEVDNDGCYVLCPQCKHRNVLKNVGKLGEPLLLVQLDA